MRSKLAASVLLGVPTAILLLIGAAEMIGGDLSGAQHLPEAAVLLTLLLAGWRQPRIVGLLLLVGAAVLLGAWLLLLLALGERALSGSAVLAVTLGLFAPPMLAGWLLIKSDERTNSTVKRKDSTWWSF